MGSAPRALRRARGVSLAELAAGVGRSIGFISQVERGLSEPSLDDLRQIASFFEVPISLFFGAAPAEPREKGKVVRAKARRKLGRATTLRQHQDITNAIRSRDPVAAAKAMRAHIETAIENLFTSSEEQESFE